MPSTLGIVASGTANVVTLYDTGSITALPSDWWVVQGGYTVSGGFWTLTGGSGCKAYHTIIPGTKFWEYEVTCENFTTGYWSALLPYTTSGSFVADPVSAMFLIGYPGVGQLNGYPTLALTQVITVGLHLVAFPDIWNAYIGGVLVGSITPIYSGDFSSSGAMGVGAYNGEIIHIQRLRCFDGVPY